MSDAILGGGQVLQGYSIFRQFLFVVSIAVWGFSSSLSWATEPPVHECDLLAADPEDAASVSPELWWNELDPGTALQACTTAVEQFPNTPRFIFQLGRVYEKMKDGQNAMKQYQTLSKLEY
ncbi:MAG: hypothetical protein VCD33_00335 [Alphaproteobacteria bacterium]